ncbi:MAG: glycosyltransferase family 39 protein [Candidatus Sumerlaeaceae bacterium]|nr:glycosyltransferase family 39 protein [Candidatus Sumerlaeaceae bacterium]
MESTTADGKFSGDTENCGAGSADTPVSSPSASRGCRIALLARVVLLGAILLVAFVLRHAQVDFGLPYAYHWDEPQIMQPVYRLLRNGVYRPSAFDYGPLNTYIHAAWGALTFLRGNQKGLYEDGIWQVKSDRDTAWYWAISAPDIWRGGRVLSVFLGVLSVALVYAAARQVASEAGAMLAAGAMAMHSMAVANFVVVSPDATACLATCLTLWASLHLARHGQRWALWTAGVAAAAAAALKYNYAPALLLPFVAHLVGPWLSSDEDRRAPAVANASGCPWNARLAGLTLIVGGSLIVFLLPALMDPTRFLHNLSTAFRYYVSPADAGVLDMLNGYLRKAAALLDSGDFRSTATVGAQQAMDFNFRIHGLLLLVMVGAGIASAVVARRSLLWLPVVSVASVFAMVGWETAFFFSRYMLPALPAALVLAGGGFDFIWRKTLAGRLSASRGPAAKVGAGAVLLAAGILILLPIGARSLRLARHTRATVEPRNEMSKAMLEKVPEESRILVLREVRWFFRPEEKKRFRFGEATICKLLVSPQALTEYDYILAPRQVAFYTRTPQRDLQVGPMNDWLKRLPKAVLAFGPADSAMFFGKPSRNPGVQLVPVDDSLRQSAPLIPGRVVFGPALDPGPAASNLAALSDGPLAIKPGVWVGSPIRLDGPTSTVVIRARGSSPFEQEDYPEITLEVTAGTTDTLFTKPVAKVILSLDRTASGMGPYERPLNLPGGDYLMRLRAKDADNLMTLIESIEFKPPNQAEGPN